MKTAPPAHDPATPPPEQAPAAPRTVQVALPASAPYVTYSIIGITVFFYVLQLISIAVFGRYSGGLDLLQIYGGTLNSAVRAGELWRLLTSALLHDNQTFLHILFNMYAVYIFGTSLERFFGHRRFSLLYLIGAFSGSVMHFAFASPNAIGFGASTSVFGLIGAEGVFFYQNRKLFAGQFKRVVGNAIFIVAANLAIGSSTGLGQWGHIGGLLGGLVFAWFAGPLWNVEASPAGYQMVDQRSMRDVIIGAATALLIFGGLAMWGMVR